MSTGLGAGLPIGRDVGAPGVTAAGFGMSAEQRCLSLLLLEDDNALRQMLVWELSDLGYEVYPAACCGEARVAVSTRDFDLALMDVGLPDGDGVALAAELVGTYPELRIVLCSGRPGNLAPERIPPEVLAYLTKPVSVDRLDALFRGGA